ncbi:MAG TPA: hypothetical protein VIM30_07655 [Candidatus Limnocylindrales bacterium]|jgi:hypothetical protein
MPAGQQRTGSHPNASHLIVIDRAVGILLPIVTLIGVAVLSFGSAGILAGVDHPPGTLARPELTWANDEAIRPGMDLATGNLLAMSQDVDRLATLARGAIAAMAARDTATLSTTLAEGRDLAGRVESEAGVIRNRLDALPGFGPDQTLRVSPESIARRDAMLAALDTTSGLASSWARVSGGALAANQLTTLLTSHDAVMADAAHQGTSAAYTRALATVAGAQVILDEAAMLRDQLANTSDVTTLDRWIAANRSYDAALKALYATLEASHGVVTAAVTKASAAEAVARAQLPPDTRGLVIIVADVGQGGLNQAAISIEQARARLNGALATLPLPSGAAPSPIPVASPTAS